MDGLLTGWNGSFCRWANSFLECGQEVLWSSDFSTDTFQLHAELLRNRAVYLRHCEPNFLFFCVKCGLLVSELLLLLQTI